jgi:hypothetical protein
MIAAVLSKAVGFAIAAVLVFVFLAHAAGVGAGP